MFDEDMFVAILTQDQTIVKVNTIFESAVSLLKAAKIIYELPKVHPKYMLVHPKNRAGLGVSWHNVHRNGSVILAVGASLKQLGNAYCIEMSTDAERCSSREASIMIFPSVLQGFLLRFQGLRDTSRWVAATQRPSAERPKRIARPRKRRSLTLRAALTCRRSTRTPSTR
jgi:hypothetical protein